MLVIGLTGGIGSGKSTVSRLFANHHVPIIDADEIARKLTQPNHPAYKKIIDHFGKAITTENHELDRKKLRLLIFENQKEKIWLEQLLHPMIQKQIQDDIKQLTFPYCIIVIPLLLETESYQFIDRILVVDAEEPLQIERVTARDGMAITHIKAILESQVPRHHRITKAHEIILNNGKIEDLDHQVEQLHLQYLKLAAEKN